MKNKLVQITMVLLMTGCLLAGCSKNETKYFKDRENKGLSIFSNTGNNIFTCYINNTPWQTENRRSPGFLSPGRSELYIWKQYDSTLHDVLVFQWYGSYLNNPYSGGYISLHLAVPPDFARRDFTSLQGKRITINSTNGYFTINTGGFNSTGKGTVYFNKSNFDSIRPINSPGLVVYTGNLSGLLEADFDNCTVTKGRFDDDLTNTQVEF